MDDEESYVVIFLMMSWKNQMPRGTKCCCSFAGGNGVFITILDVSLYRSTVNITPTGRR
jgi:hypothetical protein